MKDRFGREINYLRISVTDRCNLRCVYCMPPEGIQLMDCDEILRYEEILEVATAAHDLGVTQVRVTGGEPLVRRNLDVLVKGLKSIGFEDISLTTNGILLPMFADSLKNAGLNRVNISIDSLNPVTFKNLTRIGDLDQVMAGIKSALQVGLHPVKLNMVVVAGVNDGDVEDLARWTLEAPVHVRFIELMPIGDQEGQAAPEAVPSKEILARIGKIGPIAPSKVKGAGPATVYRLDGAQGTIGIISPMTEPFCHLCNRLRLTADGKIRPCLGSDVEYDLKGALRGDREDLQDKLKQIIVKAIRQKPQHHDLGCHHGAQRRMCQIGG